MPREGWQRKSFGNAYCQRLERTARFRCLAERATNRFDFFAISFDEFLLLYAKLWE